MVLWDRPSTETKECPRQPAPGKKVNRIGLEPIAYRGSKTTLCAGCGHNAITERIIDAFFEMGIDPTQVVKLSGIGCSSKSPAYFLNGSRTASTRCTGACRRWPPARSSRTGR